MALQQQIDDLNARVEHLESECKKPRWIDARVRLNEQSVRELRAKLMRMLGL